MQIVASKTTFQALRGDEYAESMLIMQMLEAILGSKLQLAHVTC